MKKLIFFLTLTLVSLSTFATGQEGDILYMDGVKWGLLGKPIYGDSLLSRQLQAALPKQGIVTSNWSGYTAHWSVQKGQLCLDSITYEIYKDKESQTISLPSKVMRQLFKKYIKGKRIVATWVNGDLRLGKGKVIYYQHSGFDRHYENERFVTVKQGKVCATKDYQNYVVDGFAFEDYKSRPQFDKDGKNSKTTLREMFPLHIEQYPELADVKKITFLIKKARVDAQGHLVECEVRVWPEDNPRLAKEIEEVLKAYHPWRVSYINGEFRGYGIQGFTVPYFINEE